MVVAAFVMLAVSSMIVWRPELSADHCSLCFHQIEQSEAQAQAIKNKHILQNID